MSTRGPVFLGNVVRQPGVTISPLPGYALLAVPDMEGSWLKTEEPSDRSRIATIDPLASGWHVSLPAGSVDMDFAGFSLVNSNLKKFGYYRYIDTVPNWQDIAPLSISDMNNATPSLGSVAILNIDEIIQDPDSSFIVPTLDSIPWSVRVVMSNPAASPPAGFGRGVIVLNVVADGVPFDLFAPEVIVKLFQGTTLLGNLGWRAIHARDNAVQTLVFPFDTSVLVNPNGQDIRVDLHFSPGDPGSYAKLESLRLYIDFVTTTKDSGWIRSPSFYYSTIIPDKSPTTVDCAYFPEVPWTNVSEFCVLLMDDHLENDPNPGNILIPGRSGDGSVVDPETYTEAGVLLTGEAIALVVGSTIDNPYDIGITHEGPTARTIGGQTYGVNNYRYRTVNDIRLVVTETEKNQLLRLSWAIGTAGSFFFSLRPDAPLEEQFFESFLATTLVLQKAIAIPRGPLWSRLGHPYDGERLYEMGASFEEKL